MTERVYLPCTLLYNSIIHVNARRISENTTNATIEDGYIDINVCRHYILFTIICLYI